jgi:hypothetical protein
MPVSNGRASERGALAIARASGDDEALVPS